VSVVQWRVHGAGLAASARRHHAAVVLSAGEYAGAADFAAAVISIFVVSGRGIDDSRYLWTYGRITAAAAANACAAKQRA
jgi:hypothetical protein